MRWLIIYVFSGLALLTVGGLDSFADQNAGWGPAKASETVGASKLKYPIIRSRSMSIAYQISATARQHLARVELWTARGERGTWQLYDYDRDRVSPMDFIAPSEGVYRFLVVAVDRWGRRSFQVGNKMTSYQSSSPVPPAHIQAQQVVYIDYTAPKLYLYSPRGEMENYRRNSVSVRWQGFDTSLDPKPVRLFYSQGNSDEWVSISESLSANGEFDWKIPARLRGAIRIHAVLTDMAGNEDVQDSGLIHLAEPFSLTSKQDRFLSDSEKPFVYHFIDPTIENDPRMKAQSFVDLPSEARRIQAQQSFRRGKLHSQRFEWKEAIGAYQKTLLIDPTALEAKVNLANAYFRTGKFENALEYFEKVLQEDPSRNNALFGLAQTQRALNQHDKALATLDVLLKQDRRDFQAWRMHAETAEKMGQFDVAQNSWQHAVDSPFEPIRRLAQEKLETIN